MAYRSDVDGRNRAISKGVWCIAEKVILVVWFSLYAVLFLHLGEPLAADIETELHQALESSLIIVEKAEKDLRSGKDHKAGKKTSQWIDRLNAIARSVDVSGLILESELSSREDMARALGAKAFERHQEMIGGLKEALGQYRSLVDALSGRSKSSTANRLSILKKLKVLLQRIVHKPKRPILGSLPYRDLNYAAKKPDTASSLKPAYQGGNKLVSPDDLKSTDEAPITKEIATLAQSLDWSPAAIYEYVKNNIETEWYWGCMKGAEETLKQKSGNDCDQATLLVALLRASGFPTRYVQGTAKFFPGIEKAKNLTGLDDPAKIAELLRKSGIPYKPILAGGRIANFEIEHIWVETQIPYGNYRGAVIDEQGKAWLALDTSIKANDYQYNDAVDILRELSLSQLRDDYLAIPGPETPLEFVRKIVGAHLSNRSQPASYENLLRTKVLPPEDMSIVPASLQFEQTSVTHEYTAIPDSLKHKVKLTTTAAATTLFTTVLDLDYVSNKRIALSYQPETVEDQDLINSYGGLDNTPAYLVRLRPVLKVNGDTIAVGEDGLPMGADLNLTLELISPNGTEKTTTAQIAGNPCVIGIVAQKVVPADPMPDGEKNAEQLLFEQAMLYIDRWNKAEEELASLMHLTLSRPIPTVATVGSVVEVAYLLHMPDRYEWRGVFVDASVKAAGVEPPASGMEDRPKLFMRLSALEGSILENRIFEDAFKVESISTAKLMQAIRREGRAPLVLNKANAASILPNLSFEDSIKKEITNAVNQGQTVTIPETEVTYQDFQGVGYIKESPATGEAGYMLSGMIAGGMTAWSKDKWPGDFAERLSHWFSEPPGSDRLCPARIMKIIHTDLQRGKVGSALSEPLQVRVQDKDERPLPEVLVTFTVRAGGGRFKDGSSSTTVKTNWSGIASVALILGEKTSANPTPVKVGDEKYAQQMGENIVGASVTSSGLSLPRPFTAYGEPESPDHITKTYGDETTGDILSFAGFVSATVEDKYYNPISNLDMIFSVLPAVDKSKCQNPNKDKRPVELVKGGDPCLENSPTLGECETRTKIITEKTSTKGAYVQVILGGIPEAEYPIRVQSGGLEAKFTLKSNPFGNCEGTWAPISQFYLSCLNLANEFGANVDCGKVGDQIPVKARIYIIREKPTYLERSINCDEWSITCDAIVGSREYEVIRKFKSSSVTFDDVPGTPSGADDGIFNGIHVLEPGLNKIIIKGEARIDQEITDLSCYGCTNKEETFVGKGEVEAERYGVDVKLDGIDVVHADGYGFVKRDARIAYTIEPSEYKAYTANVLIYRNGEVQAVIPSELQGKGSATIAQGFELDVHGKYEAEVVLNYNNDTEIRSKKVRIPYQVEGDAGKFTLERRYHLAQFDDSEPGLPGSEYSDSYNVIDFTVSVDSSTRLSLCDTSSNEMGTLVGETSLSPGTYSFVVDYGAVRKSLTDSPDSSEFYVKLGMKHNDGSDEEEYHYHGDLRERTVGKMLGQVMVHDVLIQDGSLNLTRQDVALKGRGPQFVFTRSYNNQPSADEFKPLGEGWTHSMDMKLRGLSTASTGGEAAVPDWVVSLRSSFFTRNDIPPTLSWTLVQVNGTMFKKDQGGVWRPDRGHHGSLEEKDNQFTFTSKDGTRYFYKNPWPSTLTPVQAVEDRNRNLMTFAYDELGRLDTIEDAVKRKFKFVYETPPGTKSERLTKVIGLEDDPDEFELIFYYNEHGYLESAKRAGRIETYGYAIEDGEKFPDYNLVQTTDVNNHSYGYEYFGRDELDPALMSFVKALKSYDVVKTVSYPDNYEAHFAYDVSAGSKRTVTDLNGNDTVYTLNYYGNPLKIEAPESKVTSMTWSIDQGKNDNVMTSKTDGNQRTTTYEYDVKGNIHIERDPYGHTITTNWSQKYSLPEWRKDRNGHEQTWQYNEDTGNLEWHEDGDQKRTHYTYWPTGEVATMTDPRQKVTSYTYDGWGNPASVAVTDGGTTFHVYDIRGRKRSVTDPNGNKTEYNYDDLDYPETIVHSLITAYSLPEGSTNTQKLHYDAMGNLLSEANRNGLNLTYAYTDRNQVKTVSRSTGGGKTYGYDGNGNLVSETDWKGQETTHVYNGLNQRTSTTNRLKDTMYMVYDPEGNLTHVTDYEGRTTDYEYDALNRRIDVSQPALPGEEKGHIRNTYYNEADPKTNLESVKDQEGHATFYYYNGRYLVEMRKNALGGVFQWEYDDSGNVSTETDEQGNTTQHEYDGRNKRVLTTKVGDAGAIATRYSYDANGNRTAVTDPLGNTTRTAYDEWNRPYKVTDPENYTTTTEYDGEGNKVKVTDGNETVRTWNRDAQGRVLQAVDGEGCATEYEYDANDNPISVKEPNGTRISTTYDAEDRTKTTGETSSSGAVRSKAVRSRDKMGNPLEVTDYLGSVTKTEYNALNLPEKVSDPSPFNNQATLTSYFKNGKVKSVTNRRGYKTSHGYDDLNRETAVTDAMGRTIQTTYDEVGNIITVTDKRGIIKKNTYDKLYRLIRVERNGTTVVTNEHDNNGNVIAVTDANGNRNTHSYNGRNLLDGTTYADGTTESRTYDGVGNLLTLTNEEKEVTTYTYDRENRETSAKFAGEKTIKTYDKAGNLTFVEKPKGNRREMRYDGFKRLTSVVEDPGGLNLTTRYEYDDNGNLVKQWDARSNCTTLEYDVLNRKTKRTRLKGSSGSLITTCYSYDEEGNLQQMTDPKAQAFTYSYDELNRQTDAWYPSDTTTPFNTITHIQTAYDPNNNIISVTEDKTGQGGQSVIDLTSNQYDNFDRLVESTQGQVTVTYSYDNNGNRTSVSTPSSSTDYTFDSRNRIETAATAGGTTSYTYTPDGKKHTITYPNGAGVQYTYFPTNRTESVTNTASTQSGSPIMSRYSYVYDQNGNRIVQTELQNGATETTNYSYDRADRLMNFTVAGGATTRSTEYTYEGYNRKKETVTQNGAVIKEQTYHYDETDWLKKIEDTSGKVISYQYDANGNLTLKADNTLPNQDMAFTYDSRNQLVQTIRGPPANEAILGLYDYNAQGLRTRHRNSDRGDIDYFYDGRSVIEEHKAEDSTLIAHYHYADRLLSLDTLTTQQYYHFDALGSTVNLTDPTGSPQTSYQLDPWGHILTQTGSSINRNVFTAKEHDENTGLIYFGARYLEPDSGRFTTQDPYLGELTTPPSLHRYLYAYSNPTVYTDLFGYMSNREMWGLDDRSVYKTLAKDCSASAVMWLTTKATAYSVWNGVTGGFVGRQDARQEKLDRGEISEKEFWTGTGIDAGVSVASQIVAGEVGGAVAGEVTAATGSSFAAAVSAGGATSGVASLMEQGAEVATYHATEGKLGQSEIDFGQVAESVASGMVVSAGLHAAGKIGEKIADRTEVSQATGRAGTEAALTGEDPSASLSVSGKHIEAGKIEKPRDKYSEDWNEWFEQNPHTAEARFRSLGAAGNSRTPTRPIKAGEVTIYDDFVDRSVVGDSLEGHEVWQHANLQAKGHVTTRLSTEASKNNPVVAMESSQHRIVNKAQRLHDAASQTARQNIEANARILREQNVPKEVINRIVKKSVKHAQNLGEM